MKRILAINPGSTSTKIGIYEDKEEIYVYQLSHLAKDLEPFKDVADQFEFRKGLILDAIKKAGYELSDFDGVVGRGGIIKPIISGTYVVNDLMCDDFKIARYGEHASNLGALLARALANGKVPAYIVDPVVVDELEDVARISGQEGIERTSKFHALNHKAVAKRHAKEKNKAYEDLNLIIAHMGGGVSVGAHKKGMCIDVNNALDGDGPFSPERAGALPVGDVVRLAYSGEYTRIELKKHFVGQGGLVSYLGTHDLREVIKMIDEGNEKAKLIYEAMAYQIGKEIAAMAGVLKGKVDGIILTGGISYDQNFVKLIKEHVSWINEVYVYPGEDELEALALGALRCLNGEEEAKIYA